MLRIFQLIANALSPKEKEPVDKKPEKRTDSGSTGIPAEQELVLTPAESARTQAGRAQVVRRDPEEGKPGPHRKDTSTFEPRLYKDIPKVGNLLLEKRLGVGHSGEVFLARTEDGKDFALKEALSGKRGIDPLCKDAAGLNRANDSGATPTFHGAFKKKSTGYVKVEPDKSGNFPDDISFILMETIKGRKAYEVIEDGEAAEQHVKQLVSGLVHKLADKDLIIKDDNPNNFYIREKEGTGELELVALDGASIHRNHTGDGYGRPTPKQIEHSIALISHAIITKGKEYRANQLLAASANT